MRRHAFTMLELMFVIVVIGIIGSVGANVLRVMYDNYISSSVNNQMHAETELALNQIANRLHYRIKDSVIAANSAQFDGLSFAQNDVNYTRIEWVGYDIDGWLGDTNTSPTWSGFIDVDAGDTDGDGVINNQNLLLTPGTDTGRVNTIITNVSGASGTTIANAAIFFTGANTDVQSGYGWGGTVLTEQNGTAAHRINVDAGGNIAAFNSGNADNFAMVDVYEQYKLAWTAYAVSIDQIDSNLYLHYDYQPWEGEQFDTDGKRVLLLRNVSTVKAQAVGDVIKLQICVDNNTTSGIPANQYYTLCKEKVIF